MAVGQRFSGRSVNCSGKWLGVKARNNCFGSCVRRGETFGYQGIVAGNDVGGGIDADGIIFDLEDSIAEGQKELACTVLLAALNDLDFGLKTVSSSDQWNRIAMYKDVISLAEKCPRLDLIVQPKVEHAWHVQFLSTLLDQVRRSKGRSQTIGIEAIIETPLGLENLREISQASPRLEALSFGAGDYAAAMRMKNHIVGAPDSSYRIRPSVECGEVGSGDQFDDVSRGGFS